jgi:predicted DNA-binding transcriptional regulator AlpA
MATKNQIVNGAGNEVWDRLPGKGYYFGLSRPYVYQMMKEGKVKTALIKQPGKLRGMRLIWRPSVLAFIERHVDAAAK